MSFADLEMATTEVYAQMTSPALFVADSRAEFLAFVELLADAHPIRECADGASDVADALARVWPKDGHVDVAAAREDLASRHMCGDTAGNEPHWDTCLGTQEGTRGYTCGVWLLLHALAARVGADADGVELTGDAATYAGERWMAAVEGWITRFFPCDECRSHFLEMIDDDGESVQGASDALLWSWRAHNRVNERLAVARRNGEEDGSSDPEHPKRQWPTTKDCASCHVASGLLSGGSGGDDDEDDDDDPSWDEEETLAFLSRYYRGDGAAAKPRSDADAASTGPRGEGGTSTVTVTVATPPPVDAKTKASRTAASTASARVEDLGGENVGGVGSALLLAVVACGVFLALGGGGRSNARHAFNGFVVRTLPGSCASAIRLGGKGRARGGGGGLNGGNS